MADLCIIPNENRATLFHAETGASNVKVVWNCPSLEEVTPPRSEYGPVLKLLYHGSIVPDRLPLTVISALKDVSHPVVLRVVGYETVGSQGYLAKMKRTAAELGISDRLEIVGTIPLREDLMRFCATCDVGLSLLPPSTDENLANMTGASNKPFDYLACGLAVLVSRLPDWQKLYVETGYGLDCDPADPKTITAAIRYFGDHPEEVQAMGERGRQRILSEWNYQTQFQETIQLLSGIPGNSLPRSLEQSVYSK
jgi:glycosyltransferase involved in cell wall biosynthesis